MADQNQTDKNHTDQNHDFKLTSPDVHPEPVKCWTCQEPMGKDPAKHNCIAALKHHIQRIEQEYGELKEQAIDAGINVRLFHL